MSYLLLNPWGEAPHGGLVSAATATKDVAYSCPSCEEPLLLKRGEVYQAHFAHRSDSECRGETALHLTAKRLLAQVVHKWKSGEGGQPQIYRPCDVCLGNRYQGLPDSVEEARVEVTLPSGRIADVALFGGGKILAVVEVLVSHAVDAEKAAVLDYPWLEVLGADVVAEPLYWQVTQGRLAPFACSPCKAREAARLEYIDSVFQTPLVPVPPLPYEVDAINCWRCGTELQISCQECRAVQGKHYLHCIDFGR